MFALRRVAVRTLQYQPTRQLLNTRTVSLTSRIESSKPSLYRSFHQSRQWLAEEQKTTESPAEAEGGETVTVEPSAEEQKEIKEESIATPEVAHAAPTSAVPESVSQATEQVKNAAQSATDALSGVAGRVSDAVSGRPARSSFPNNDSASTKILYVGNLFFEVTAAELEAEFGRFGEIVNSRVVTDPKGQSKGFGYLEFSSAEAAQNAIRELDQKVFQGRRMAVQQHVRREQNSRGGYSRDGAQGRGFKRENPPSKTLFIGNMSYQMSDRDLNDLFREIRNVLDVRVAIDRRSGQPRGFAHADFIDVASAEKAKEFLGKKVVYGRQLRVDFSATNAQETPASQ